MRNKRNATIALVLGTIACLVGGWLLLRGATSLETFPLNTLNPMGRKADIIYDLVVPVFAVAGIVFIAVEVGVLWMAARFRRNDTDLEGEGEPVQIHGSTGLEIGWTIVPAVILAVIAVFNANGILQMEEVRDDVIDVTVIGQQWWWEFRYDTDADGAVDIITATQLVMPAGRDVRVQIQSADVIHSFWIPALNGKKDAVPGRTHPLVLEAAEPGIYEGQCTEFCGLSHGVMRMQVKVLPPEEYDQWVKDMTTPPEQPTEEMAIAGQETFVQQCVSCHQVNGLEPGAEAPYEYADMPNPNYGEDVDSTLLSKNAPNLTHLMMRDTFAGNLLDLYLNDDVNPVDTNVGSAEVRPTGEPHVNNLKRWLRNPEEVKPMDPDNNQGMPNLGLSEQQIDELVAYLVTLK